MTATVSPDTAPVDQGDLAGSTLPAVLLRRAEDSSTPGPTTRNGLPPSASACGRSAPSPATGWRSTA